MTHRHGGGVLGAMKPHPTQDHRLYVTYDPETGVLDAGVNNERVYSRFTQAPQAHLDDLLAAVTDKLTASLAPFLGPLKRVDAP